MNGTPSSSPLASSHPPNRLRKAVRCYEATALIVFTTIVLFVAVNVMALFILLLLPPRQNPVSAKYGPKEVASVYKHLTPQQVSKLLNESWSAGVVYEPYLHFREAPRRGEYVNVDPIGFRHSANQCPWPPNPKHFNLFVFGGSTTFGYGVADGDTVPSQLGRMLAQALRTNVCVYNFGRCYYQCTQERILFEQLILQGHVPRMAVFIDGLNDCYYPDGVPPTDTRIVQTMAGSGDGTKGTSGKWLLPVVALFRELTTRNQHVAQPGQPQAEGSGRNDEEAAARAVSFRYIKNMGLINRIAASYEIETWFVWQPIPTYKYDTRCDPFASGIGDHWRSKSGYEHLAEMRRSLPLPPNFLWCADLQENLKEPLYVDAVHYTREMSERLAADIVSQILARRQSLSKGGTR